MKALSIALCILASSASAHESVSGMTFPSGCCGNRDCKAIRDDQVQAVTGGWLVKSTGEVISYKLVKDSIDGMFYRCSLYQADDKPTICLIVPPMGQ